MLAMLAAYVFIIINNKNYIWYHTFMGYRKHPPPWMLYWWASFASHK